MEEKKTTAVEETAKEQPRKLTYEELEQAAKQISVQAEQVIKENQMLKAKLQQVALGNMYTELGFKFEVLKAKEFFSEEFVGRIVKDIEEIMTPQEEQKEETKE